jgi:glutamine amidotransferase
MRGVVLPGVGAFSACMENLGKFGLIEPIREIVREHKPFLGICLGFQLLFSESEEFGKQKGLDLFSGKVVGFHASGELKVPHMGWNRIDKQQDSPFLDGITSGDYVYFVHSFTSCRMTARSYHDRLRQAVCLQYRDDRMFACQFHPEKVRFRFAHS